MRGMPSARTSARTWCGCEPRMPARRVAHEGAGRPWTKGGGRVIGAQTAGFVTESWRHRSLTVSFVRRQYQLRYRQSLVGFVWVIVPPIASLVVATLVFGKVIGVDTGDVPYPLFALAGLVPWSFLASSLTTGVPS